MANLSPDVITIFSFPTRYIAAESRGEIELTSDVRQSIVVGICSESGRVDPSCFDDAVEAVTDVIESQHFPQFLHSQFYTKLIVSTVRIKKMDLYLSDNQ